MNNNSMDDKIDLQKEREDLGKEKPKAKDTARLVWASKPKKEPIAKDLDFQTAEEVYSIKEGIKRISNENKKLNTFYTETKDVSGDPNRIIWGDNLLVMKALLAKGYEGQIDLIYIDPPFNTGENFNFVNEVEIGDEKLDKEISMRERLAYTDTWRRGIDSFLDMLYPRLQLIRKLLSDKGSLFLHCDNNAAHYIKVILDEIFGRNNFQNQITWQKIRVTKGQSKGFGNVSDTIFYYTKSNSSVFEPQYLPYPEKYQNSHYRYTDEKTGKKYRLCDFTQKGQGAPKKFGDKGVLTPPPGKHWIWAQERIDDGLKQGLIVFTKSGTPTLKRFLDDAKGQNITDLWTDIFPVNSMAQERVNYPTQKPEALLERIFESVVKKGDFVADFFMGSGTTLAAAEKFGLHWIGSDLSKTSIQVTRSRLVNLGAKPFLIQNLGNYQRQLIYSSEVNFKEMYDIILKLYGAIPRKDRQAFGVSKSDKNTLVYVCEPDRPMMADKALNLAREAKNMDGNGYRRIVILAWDYELGFDQDWKKITIKKKDISDIEFKIIPSDVYKYLRSTKVGDPEISDKIAFYQKPYLKLGTPKKISDYRDDARVEIELERYVILDIPLRDNQKKSEYLLRKNFDQLIDYWAIDWDYDGEIFRSSWQAIKGRRNSEPVLTTAEINLKKGKKYRIAVRVVDVFGNDAFGIKEIDLK